MNVHPALLLAGLLLAHACGISPRTPQSASEPTATTGVPEPDANDLLEVLKGQWIHLSNPSNKLEINANSIRHFRDGVLQQEGQIDIDGTCAGLPCQNDLPLAGWCFVEKNGDQTACYLVVKCDADTLRFVRLGNGNTLEHFKKN